MHCTSSQLYCFFHAGVFVSLNGTFISNHGYVALSDIGSTDETALLCHTNRPLYPGLLHSGGDWFSPSGVRLAAKAQGLRRARGPMAVRLQRTNGTPAEGIYRCSVQDDTSNYHRLYVGIYNINGGGK